MVSHFLKHKRVEGRLEAKAWGNPLISSVLQEHKAEVKSSIVSSNLNVEKVYWVDEGTEFLSPHLFALFGLDAQIEHQE